jgi:invasin-like protein
VPAASGVAPFTNLRIRTPVGLYTLQASTASLPTVSSSAFNIVVGPATRDTFNVQPATTAILDTIQKSIGGMKVWITDSIGNLVTTDNTHTVTMTLFSGPSATLGGTKVRTAVAGVATFADLTINKVGTGYTLLATSNLPGNPSDFSAPFDIIPGPAKTLVFQIQPTTSVAGQPIVSVTPPAVQVAALDVAGDTANGFTGNVTMSLNPSSGGLAGTTTVAAVAGISTFSNLIVNLSGNYTLTAAATGVTSGTSNSFTVQPGGVSAAQSMIAASPGSITACSSGCTVPTSASTITVTAKDAQGNLIPGATVTLAATGSGNTIVQPALPTNSQGQTSGTISSSVSGETKTVSATINGVTITPTASVVVNPAGAAVLVFTRQPPASVTAGATISPPIQVEVRDVFGNKVSNASNLITLTILQGGRGTPSNNTATPSAGTASFNGLSISTATTNGVTQILTPDSLVASATGLASDTSAGFAVNPAAVSTSQSTIGANPGTISASSGSSASTITVTAKDAFGNVIQGATVVLAANPTTGNSLTQPSGTTNGSGAASGTLSSTKAETKTVSATINGNAITATSTVTVTADGVSASQSTIGSAPGTITASTGSSASTITVTAKDQFGNPIQGATVVLAASPTTGNTLTQPASTTNGSGVASGSLSTTKAETKTVSATINGIAITPVATVTVNPAALSASQSTISASPGTITASSGSSASTIIVTAKDQFGNPIPGATVVLAASPTTGNTLTQPASTTNGSGAASGSLSTTRAETKTVSATVNGTAITPTATVAVNPDVPDHLAFVGQPTDTKAGHIITPAVTVAIQDQFNNLVGSATDNVSVAIGTNGGVPPGTLAGTLSVAAIGGVATFNDLSIDNVGGYTLVASDASLTGATSVLFNITP